MTSRPSSAAPILAVLAIVLVTLGAYVASAGPAVWLVNHGYLTARQYGAFYSPLQASTVYCGVFEWLEWYMLLFR